MARRTANGLRSTPCLPSREPAWAPRDRLGNFKRSPTGSFRAAFPGSAPIHRSKAAIFASRPRRLRVLLSEGDRVASVAGDVFDPNKPGTGSAQKRAQRNNHPSEAAENNRNTHTLQPNMTTKQIEFWDHARS
jgi:hypothetical protein